ncbi:MAG: acyl-CoA thioesterase domain-containing protein [Burkholderiales bacterium]
MTEVLLPPWNDTDLPALLQLDTVAPLRFRSRHGDPNNNGRSYGGQLLGQALMAASYSVPADRPASALQLVFLQGAIPDVPLEFEVTVLQEGRRFSSRGVRASQNGRFVLDAHVTFALDIPSPGHTSPSTAQELPTSLPRMNELARDGPPLRAASSYTTSVRACIDCRIVGGAKTISELDRPRLRYWMKALMQSTDRRVHEAAFAYLSDWWTNYSVCGPHVDPQRPTYGASLNHSIWFHRPFQVSDWLHVDSESGIALNGRGLALARVHDEHGVFLATVAQDTLMAYA